MHDGPLLAPPLLVAAVLVLSGVAKLLRPQSARDAFVSLRLPRALAESPVPTLVPWAELALALALLVLPGVWGVAAALAALVLMLVYLAVIVRALGFDEPVTCSCFGALGLGDVTWRTAARNALLATVAGLAVWSTWPGDSVVARLVDADATTWGWLGMILLAAAAAVLVLDGGPQPPQTGPPPEQAAELDYLRQPIPFGLLEAEDGTKHPLRVLAAQRAVLLVFVSLGCGPCMRITPRIPQWAEEIQPVDLRVVIGTPFDGLDGEHERLRPYVLRDPDGSVMQTFSTGSPSAVLLGADALLAGGPVVGEDDVVAFVADIREQLREDEVIPEPTPELSLDR